MARCVVFAGLLVALVVAASAQGAAGRPSDDGLSLPGVAIEALGRSPAAGLPGAELVLPRVTLEPGVTLPDEDGVRAAVMSIESGRVDLEVERGEVDVTLAGDRGQFSLSPGETVMRSHWRRGLPQRRRERRHAKRGRCRDDGPSGAAGGRG